MLTMWSKMMHGKKEKQFSLEKLDAEKPDDFERFFTFFSRYDPVLVPDMVKASLDSNNDRQRMGYYLIKNVLQSYNGQYNPHSLTGLGSTLWIIKNFSDHPAIVTSAVFQYLDYFFDDIS
jgi:hypothetical protein